MRTFALQQIELPSTATLRVALLEVDGACPYDRFSKKSKQAGLKKELLRFRVYLENLAHETDLPNNALTFLKDVSAEDEWREFELRQKRLRLYCFYLPPDNIIVVVGEFKKGNKEQKQTIERFRSLKDEFRNHYIKQANEEE